ncbi:MAG: ATP-binding protein [Clostridiales bacterium]|nr:ATP-binding protein [Clostridiales bacterium]
MTNKEQPMDSVYEDVKSILENRRIRSEILLKLKKDQIRKEHPEIESIEQEIDKMTEDTLLAALEGKSCEDLASRIAPLEKKRDDLLKDLGVDPQILLPEPFCKHCNDTGYIRKPGKDGTVETDLCVCVRELLAPVMLSRSGVENYPNYSFDKAADSFYEGNATMQELFEKLRKLAEKEKLPNAVFYGKSGKGKTFTAVSCARAYAKQGRSALVIRQAEAQELMMEHRKAIQSFYMAPSKEKEIEERVGYLTQSDLLVLDDLGVEARTPNTEADLLYLLDTRMLAGKTTIITTNFDLESLKERYGGRFFDRIDRSFKMLRFTCEG